MLIEENKAIVRRYKEEVWNRGEMDVAEKLVAANHVQHGPSGKVTLRGLEALKQWAIRVLTAWPDFHVAVEDMVAEGDKVTLRWRFRGTHKGEWMGVAPIGKEVTNAGIEIYRIAGGKIEECWGSSDALGAARPWRV